MPTIPLFTPPSHADAWHQVAAPGGYEWWHFDAEDFLNDRQIVADFFDGNPLDPGYARAYAGFRKNPTGRPPPLPRQFRFAHFAIYERGQLLWSFAHQFPPADFRARTDRPDVMLGSNQFHQMDDGSLMLRLRGTPSRDQTLAAELLFKPVWPHSPIERAMSSKITGLAEHQWVIANPLCEVTGTIELFGGEIGKPRIIQLGGRGYHDHHYGTRPFSTLNRWMRGRALTDDGMLAFQLIGSNPLAVIEANASGIREIEVGEIKAEWSRHGALRIHFPKRLRIGNDLELSKPRIIDSSAFGVRAIYDLQNQGTQASAFCEITQPNRLGWLIFAARR